MRQVRHGQLGPFTVMNEVAESAGFLGALDERHAQAVRAMKENARLEPYPVALYFSHHHEALPAVAGETRGAGRPDEESSSEELVARLRLVRIAFNAESETGFVLMDYSIAPEETQYVLSVRFTRSGDISSIEMES